MSRTALSYSPPVEKSLRILLAEDDNEMRRLLGLVLRGEGHDVVEARDGAELLEAVATSLVSEGREDFDLIISEQPLPGMPGLAILAGLRARERHTPFVLITDDPRIKLGARRLGALILDGPFDVEAIRGAVRKSADG
jgi:CheY-like chemotaxis protein